MQIKMEQFKHFSHKHVLVLNKEHTGADMRCHGCHKPITIGTLYYRCSRSNSTRETCDKFFLHQTCAKLPLTLQHPMHPLHPLTLYSSRKKIVLWYCAGCRNTDMKLFTYVCTECDFYICLRCLFDEGMLHHEHVEDRDFHHEGHKQHSLTLHHTRALFECDACGTEKNDLSYKCNSCPFWIHHSCALLPRTRTCRSHSHPLVLAFSLPEKYLRFRELCAICRNRVFPKRWLYYCADCRFFAHLQCATSADENITEQRLLARFVDTLCKILFF